MAYCVLRTEKIKSMGSFSNKMNHNFRIGNVPNADPDRQHLNKTLIPMEEETYIDAFNKKMYESKHQPRKNAVYGIEVMMSYNSREVDKDFDIDEWSEGNMKWLKEHFGEDNVISAVLHRDEGPVDPDAKDGTLSAHIHAIIIPMVEGKLNAKHFLSGREKLHNMQTSYGKAMEKYGLERGMERSRATHEDIKTFYGAVNKTFENTLPQPEKDENIQDYYNRANEYYVESNLKHLDEIKKMERKVVESQTLSVNISLDERLEFQEKQEDYEKQRKKLILEIGKFAREKAEFEKTVEDSKQDTVKVHNFNLIVDGLKNYPNKEKAQQVAKDINSIIRWQNDFEKADETKDKNDIEIGSDENYNDQSNKKR